MARGQGGARAPAARTAYALEQWLREQRRAFAIENGQIEQLYTLRRGVTEQLVVEGLECVRGAHTIEGVLDDETLQGLLMDQEAALEMTFSLVSGDEARSDIPA